MADYSKPDYWSLKARKEGYPARSVYKLIEIDEKFGLIKSGRPAKILDLGAAPGSWSLCLMRRLSAGKPGFSLVSADILPLSRQYDHGLFDNPDFFFVQGDFTQPEIREAILSRGPYSLIVSDAAPATTGNRSVDTLRSLDLAETVLDMAVSSLAVGGNFASKVFQGTDTAEFLKKIKSMFETGKSFKPQACRAESFETYFIGLGKKPNVSA